MKKQRRRDISSEAKPLGKYGAMRRKLKIDPIRLWARDRRLAAVHEAGHAVIERVLGVPVGLAYVYLTPDRDLDPLCCRTWLGRTHYASKLANSRQRADDRGSRCRSGALHGLASRLMRTFGSSQRGCRHRTGAWLNATRAIRMIVALKRLPLLRRSWRAVLPIGLIF
jgi:hypothetical protein